MPTSSSHPRSLWSIWAPLPLLVLVLLDWTFPLYFWQIPKLTGRAADYGYQFLVDVHRLEHAPAAGPLRVLAFGSSVAGSFDPYQVESLVNSASPDRPVEVRRLLKPSMKPSDYRLFFTAEPAAVRPDIAIELFNLQDFLHSSLERDLRPDVQQLLPPWATLLERFRSLPLSDTLDLLLASSSNFYRYRAPVRSSLEDHARATASWLRRANGGGAYGIYADGYTRRRFGLKVRPGTTLDLEYLVHPSWIEQRGAVRIDFDLGGRRLATRTETRPGWKTVRLELPAGNADILDVTSDSTWTERAGGPGDDLRLLGVRLRAAAVGADSARQAPFRYPPVDERDTDDFLRMGGATDGAFAERWQAALAGDDDLGTRMRAWREARRALRTASFEPTGEFRELERLVADLSSHGTSVILVNTPECPLMSDYQDSSYYRGYRDFFRGLARKYPGVQFHDLLDRLPADDFNDLMHVTYIGAIKLGPAYAAMIERAIDARTAQNRT